MSNGEKDFEEDISWKVLSAFVCGIGMQFLGRYKLQQQAEGGQRFSGPKVTR